MLKPTQDYILVRPLIRKQSGVIEVVSNEKHCRGEVIAIGPGELNKHGKHMPMDVRVGEIVAFGDGNFDFYPKLYGPITPMGTQEMYRVIQEKDICFIIEDEPDHVPHDAIPVLGVHHAS